MAASTQHARSTMTLFNNMPAMVFSKDAETGRYLACNQPFAEYAHKETPEGVVGLTDFDIFDKVTAAHFVEDDKRALGMDEPHVFIEDVPDATGEHFRHLQTTKMKFVDDEGRLCTLGTAHGADPLPRYPSESRITGVR